MACHTLGPAQLREIKKKRRRFLEFLPLDASRDSASPDSATPFLALAAAAGVPVLHHHRPPSRPLLPARLRPAGCCWRPCPCDGASKAAVVRGAVGLGAVPASPTPSLPKCRAQLAPYKKNPRSTTGAEQDVLPHRAGAEHAAAPAALRAAPPRQACLQANQGRRGHLQRAARVRGGDHGCGGHRQGAHPRRHGIRHLPRQVPVRCLQTLQGRDPRGCRHHGEQDGLLCGGWTGADLCVQPFDSRRYGIPVGRCAKLHNF